MAQFSYKVLDKAGKTKKGNVEADNIEKARAALKSQGYSIVELGEASALSKDINISFRKKKVKVREYF